MHRNPRCRLARPTRTAFAASRGPAGRDVGVSPRKFLAEMSAALRAHAAKANPTKDQQHARRALFQRIIQYLTIGIDMSPLFSDVIMNAHTKDMATKKMLYHYLTHYAQAKADLALLTVNTLQKDCRDEDPVVRGLAVRSMASMRVPDLVEYLVRSRLALARATKRRTGPAPHLSPRAAPPPPPLGGKSDIARRARTGPKAVRRAPFFLLAKPVNPKTSLTFPSPIALSQIGAVQHVCRTRTHTRARPRRWAS